MFELCAYNHPLSDVSLVCKHWRPQEAINRQKTLVNVAKRHNMPTAGADNEGFPRGVQHLHWAQLSLLTISPLLYFDFDFGSAPANHQHHHAKDSLLELAVVVGTRSFFTLSNFGPLRFFAQQAAEMERRLWETRNCFTREQEGGVLGGDSNVVKVSKKAWSSLYVVHIYNRHSLATPSPSICPERIWALMITIVVLERPLETWRRKAVLASPRSRSLVTSALTRTLGREHARLRRVAHPLLLAGLPCFGHSAPPTSPGWEWQAALHGGARAQSTLNPCSSSSSRRGSDRHVVSRERPEITSSSCLFPIPAQNNQMYVFLVPQMP